jgi:hypothetical protein
MAGRNFAFFAGVLMQTLIYKDGKFKHTSQVQYVPWSVQVIAERHVCNLAYQTASPKDLKYEPTGITVFKNPQTPTPM